ncbi:hypothetical protein JAAARDRAFT_91404, partial [Jaapia argillacea MUCL 33604]
KLSLQDCVTAYMVTVLNRCSDVAIRSITNAASYRHLKTKFIDPDVAGNAIYIIKSSTFEPADLTNATRIGEAIRDSIERSRSPTFVEQWMSVASYLMLSAANSGRSIFFAPESEVLSVNSNLALDWRSIDFGAPGSRSQFFTAGVSNHY